MRKKDLWIIFGAILAAVLLVSIAVPDTIQRNQLAAVNATEGEAYTEALETLWDANPEVSDWNNPMDTAKHPLQELIGSKEEFTSIPFEIEDEQGKAKVNPDYTAIVVPARQAYAAQVTAQNPGSLITFMILLFFTLVAMGSFRSPAVALMPDVTVKPLRSKANAVINLMGSAGGVLVLVLGMILGTGSARNALMSYTVFFIIVAAIMLIGLAIFVWKVREKKWAEEMEADTLRLGLAEGAEDKKEDAQPSESRKLSRGEKLSLFLILASVVFWFMGYNAVTSKYSVYASTVLNVDYNTTMIIAQAAASVAYLPVGILSSKLGRKKMILAGVVILATSFFSASFLGPDSPELVKTLLMPVLFALAGIGWATINVNSYPMVVELAKGSNVGKYTGFYYTASMAAQIVTPIFSGALMDVSYYTLFPYAAIFVALAFVTMLFVRHGDAKPDAKQVALDAAGGGDD